MEPQEAPLPPLPPPPAPPTLAEPTVYPSWIVPFPSDVRLPAIFAPPPSRWSDEATGPSAHDLRGFKAVERISAYELAKAYGRVPAKSRPKRKVEGIDIDAVTDEADGRSEVASGSGLRPVPLRAAVLSGEAILTSRPVPLNAANANQAPRLDLNAPGHALRLLPVEVADTVSVGDLELRRVPSPLEDAVLSDGEAIVRGDASPAPWRSCTEEASL